MSEITNDWLNQVWHRMLYSCTYMPTVGVKGLSNKRQVVRTTFDFFLVLPAPTALGRVPGGAMTTCFVCRTVSDDGKAIAAPVLSFLPCHSRYIVSLSQNVVPRNCHLEVTDHDVHLSSHLTARLPATTQDKLSSITCHLLIIISELLS